MNLKSYLTLKNFLIVGWSLIILSLAFEAKDLWAHFHPAVIAPAQAMISPATEMIPEAVSVVSKPPIKLTRFSNCPEVKSVLDAYGIPEAFNYNIHNGWNFTNFINKLRSCDLWPKP